jgi:hypothetical protein
LANFPGRIEGDGRERDLQNVWLEIKIRRTDSLKMAANQSMNFDCSFAAALFLGIVAPYPL